MADRNPEIGTMVQLENKNTRKALDSSIASLSVISTPMVSENKYTFVVLEELQLLAAQRHLSPQGTVEELRQRLLAYDQRSSPLVLEGPKRGLNFQLNSASTLNAIYGPALGNIDAITTLSIINDIRQHPTKVYVNRDAAFNRQAYFAPMERKSNTVPQLPEPASSRAPTLPSYAPPALPPYAPPALPPYTLPSTNTSVVSVPVFSPPVPPRLP